MTDLVGKRVRVKDASWLPKIAQAFVGDVGLVVEPGEMAESWWVGFDGGRAFYYESELEVLDASNPSKEAAEETAIERQYYENLANDLPEYHDIEEGDR